VTRKLAGPAPGQQLTAEGERAETGHPGQVGRGQVQRPLDAGQSHVDDRVVEHQHELAGQLKLDPDDLRLHVLVELTTTAFSISGRRWVRQGGQGGRQALLAGFADAVEAIPASIELSAPT
jgi:hypothetical protein